MTDMGQDDEWETEADALDCLVATNPCADACDGLEAPSEGCLECLDDEGMLQEHSMNSAPMMVKSLNKIVLAKEGGMEMEEEHEKMEKEMKEKKEKKEKKQGGDDDMDMDMPCMDACEGIIESLEHMDMEACGMCVENMCVEECACDMDNEEDPCWEDCMNCVDPMGCHQMTDMGQDDEWETEADALDCLVESFPCADACDGLEAPSEG